ncbi:MAG TPA: hypothetical protein PKJ98_21010 [Verrucomicrobiota bacterium]|nr:hypothetical protein [Verrucomicrobiota bacterium]
MANVRSAGVGRGPAALDDEPYRNRVANAQARSLVREREATAANAGRMFKRSEELLATKAVSIHDRDNAAASHEKAQARLKSAQDHLALLEAGFRVEDIAQARA